MLDNFNLLQSFSKGAPERLFTLRLTSSTSTDSPDSPNEPEYETEQFTINGVPVTENTMPQKYSFENFSTHKPPLNPNDEGGYKTEKQLPHPAKPPEDDSPCIVPDIVPREKMAELEEAHHKEFLCDE